MFLKCLANISCEVPGNLKGTDCQYLEVRRQDLLLYYVISVHLMELEVKTIQGLINLLNLILFFFKGEAW